MQPENRPVETKEQTELRLKIRAIREGFFGSYEKASAGLGFNKNTIASYEKGLTLPDVDFLFVFADRTGADRARRWDAGRFGCPSYKSAGRERHGACSALYGGRSVTGAPGRSPLAAARPRADIPGIALHRRR